MDKFHIRSFTLTNNIRLLNSLGVDKFHIDLDSDDNIIGVVGSNGSGKSTILEELNPFPVYSRYIPGREGGKTIVLSNGSIEYTISYIFEPKKDRHSACVYIRRKNLITGTTEDINPNGSIRAGLQIISEEIGISSDNIGLFNMTYKQIPLVDSTTSERRAFIERFMGGLEVIRKTAVEINDKRKVVDSLLKATRVNLENISDIVLLENTLSGKEETLKGWRDGLFNLMSNNDDPDKLQTSINLIEMDLISNKARLDSMVSAMNILDEYGIEGKSVTEYNSYLSELVAGYATQRDKAYTDMMELDSTMMKYDVRESLTDGLDNVDIPRLELAFENMTDEEREEVEFDIDSYYKVKMMIDNLDTIYKNYISDHSDTDIKKYYGMSRSEYADINSGFIRSMNELEEELKNVIKTMSEFRVMNTLSNIEVPGVKDCEDCKLRYKVNSLGDDYINLNNQVELIENKINEARSSQQYFSVLFEQMGNLEAELKTYDESQDIKTVIGEDFDAFNVIISKDFDKYKYMVGEKIRKVNEFKTYMKIKEVKRLNNIITEADNKSRELNVSNRKASEDIYDKYTEVYDRDNKILKRLNRDIGGNKNKYFGYTRTALIDNLAETRENTAKYEADIKDLKSRLEICSDVITAKKDIELKIAETESEIDSIKSDIVLNKKLLMEMDVYSMLSDEYSTIFNVTSKTLIAKVVNRFMRNIQDKTNKFFIDVDLVYRISTPIITDEVFKIPVIFNGEERDDICNTSSGEKAITGLGVSFSCQDLIDTKYDVSTLDEVDTNLDSVNRVKFIEVLQRYINAHHKQVFVISHNGNFDIYKSNISYIILKGADTVHGCKNILWDYNANK